MHTCALNEIASLNIVGIYVQFSEGFCAKFISSLDVLFLDTNDVLFIFCFRVNNTNMFHRLQIKRIKQKIIHDANHL